MWEIVAIFTLSITLAKRKYCISTWCLPHLYRSQTQLFSNEPKICHICIMLKVIPLKCIILTGILLLAKNTVGVCHISLPSINRGSGSSILILHVQPCMTSEILPHVSMGFHHMPGTPGPLFPYSSSPHHRRSRLIFFTNIAWWTLPTSKITDILTYNEVAYFSCVDWFLSSPLGHKLLWAVSKTCFTTNWAHSLMICGFHKTVYEFILFFITLFFLLNPLMCHFHKLM